jgi:3-methyladenine DNA glycosylase AlkD
VADAAVLQRFFKTGPGEYGEGDVFLGVRVPAIRALVRETRGRVGRSAAYALLDSPLHEARMLGLLILVDRFHRGDEEERRSIYDAYLGATARINNWDLVDLSAEHIVGGWLLTRDRRVLDRLARSEWLWDRRIAVLATFHFIRRGQFEDTLRLAAHLLGDSHDLMHKAVGWMLREVGKRSPDTLRGFLAAQAAVMPRTMLRYAIERLPDAERRRWMAAGPSRRASLPRPRRGGTVRALERPP